jgi:hypothetical protein
MSSDRSLRVLLHADAALCFACGLPGLLGPGWLAAFLAPGQEAALGAPFATLVLALSLALAAYAGLLLAMATRPRVSRGFVAITAAGDALWVIGTLAVLIAAGGAVSHWGAVALFLVAADTALLGALKWRALRRAGAPAAA